MVLIPKHTLILTNSYFSSISTIDDTYVTLPNMYSLCNNNLSNIFIEEQEISDIITILPVNKAIGPDCISHKMLKSPNPLLLNH